MTDLATAAVVLARGLGTRMRREDSAAPLDPAQSDAAQRGLKAMIPDRRGRPFLDHVFTSLVRSGVTNVAVIVAPDQPAIEAHYTAHPPRGIDLALIPQLEPIGTADAVLASAEWTNHRPFLVLNADNLYPEEAISALVRLGEPGVVAFDAHALAAGGNFGSERINAFAIMELRIDGTLGRIVEKPTATNSLTAADPRWVSMNLWRFDDAIFAACRAVVRSVRGEFELPQAVELAVERGMRLRAVRMRATVLDLSNRGDVVEVARRLGALEVVT